MPDALFGNDGTELPEVLPDPSGRGDWRDSPVTPPLVLPVLPDMSMMREAIAAALADDPPRPVDQELDAAAQPSPAQPSPAQADAAQPGAAQPAAAQPSTGQPDAAHPADAQPRAAQTQVAPPPPASSAPQAAPPGGAPGHRPAAPVTTTVTAPGPLLRRTGRLRHRTPLAAASREAVPQAHFDHRIHRRGHALPLRTRSNGGAGIALTVGLVVFGLLVYFIITGIVESIARLLPW